MKRGQTIPRQWLVADERLGERLWPAVRALPPGSGILFLYRGFNRTERALILRKLRRIAAARRLVLADEAAGQAARVHSMAELRKAGLGGVPILFLSPIFETRSHPDWPALPRLRSAALVRLARVPVVALGGMDAQRYARVVRLGFSGWAGIAAWLEAEKLHR